MTGRVYPENLYLENLRPDKIVQGIDANIDRELTKDEMVGIHHFA